MWKDITESVIMNSYEMSEVYDISELKGQYAS